MSELQEQTELEIPQENEQRETMDPAALMQEMVDEFKEEDAAKLISIVDSAELAVTGRVKELMEFFKTMDKQLPNQAGNPPQYDVIDLSNPDIKAFTDSYGFIRALLEAEKLPAVVGERLENIDNLVMPYGLLAESLHEIDELIFQNQMASNDMALYRAALSYFHLQTFTTVQTLARYLTDDGLTSAAVDAIEENYHSLWNRWKELLDFHEIDYAFMERIYNAGSKVINLYRQSNKYREVEVAKEPETVEE